MKGCGQMLPDRLRSCRKAANYTQQELAEKLDVTQQTVGFWETGRRNPDVPMLVRLAGIFHVTTDYLLGLSDTVDKANAEAPIVPKTVAAHSNGPMTPEMEARIQELIQQAFEIYGKK